MTIRVAVFVLCCAALAAPVRAQHVEMVFTPGVSQQAVALKSALAVDKANVDSFGALALVGAPADRKKAYADKVARNTAVVVLGEDALKAIADIEFAVPVIAINATGRCTAPRVIRVFDAGSLAAPANTQAGESLTAITDALKSGRDVALKGNANWIVRVVVLALK